MTDGEIFQRDMQLLWKQYYTRGVRRSLRRALGRDLLRVLEDWSAFIFGFTGLALLLPVLIKAMRLASSSGSFSGAGPGERKKRGFAF